MASMDAIDIVGALLGTAIACSPLVLLAYRQSDRDADQRGFLASLNNTLASTAPLLILGALHVAILIAAFYLVRAHWDYLHASDQQQGWWFFVWVALFFTLSYVSMSSRPTKTPGTTYASRSVLSLFGVFCAAFLAPYLWEKQTGLLFRDYSRIIAPSMAAAWGLLAGARVFVFHRQKSRLQHGDVQGNRPGSDLLLLQNREAELMSLLDQQGARLAHAEAERNHLDEDLQNRRKREAELIDALDRQEMKLVEAETERSRLDEELRHAQVREEELRTVLEGMRVTQMAAVHSAAEEHARLEREIGETCEREQELLGRMEKLSVVITFLRRRDHKTQSRDGGSPFDKLIDADSYYAGILGVRGRVSLAAVKERHHELVLQNHPDRVEALDPAIRTFAEIRMKEMNEAYQYFKKKFGI